VEPSLEVAEENKDNSLQEVTESMEVSRQSIDRPAKEYVEDLIMNIENRTEF